MRLSFNRFPRNLPGLVSCMAFALTAVAGIEARGAITLDTDPNSNQALARRLASSIIVDWNLECHTLPVAGLEDQERAELPDFSPEDLDCTEVAQSSEDAVANKVHDSADVQDTNAADDGDYMEYKYGHYGHYFGGNSDASDSTADDANQYDFSTPADDPNNSENYRYMPLEEQVGRNHGSVDDDADNSSNPKEGVESDDEGDDAQMADGEVADEGDSSDDTASDDDSDASGEFTNAVVAITSQMADDWTGQYGMKASDVARLLGANN